MSVLIKGMEMPDKCGHCRFATAFECEVTKNFITTFNIRQQDCPLVPVPPHGRLGDLDKLENGLRHMAKYQHGDRQQGILGCCETIRLAPTVLEAEEVET